MIFASGQVVKAYEGKSSGSESRMEPAILLDARYLLVGVFLSGEDDPAIQNQSHTVHGELGWDGGNIQSDLRANNGVLGALFGVSIPIALLAMIPDGVPVTVPLPPRPRREGVPETEGVPAKNRG